MSPSVHLSFNFHLPNWRQPLDCVRLVRKINCAATTAEIPEETNAYFHGTQIHFYQFEMGHITLAKQRPIQWWIYKLSWCMLSRCFCPESRGARIFFYQFARVCWAKIRPWNPRNASSLSDNFMNSLCSDDKRNIMQVSWFSEQFHMPF